ncbi:hypothetical protein KIMH_14520 [Bombiscardovia apis]|uniref:DUF2188 domain-containing protein n=1 Tax=Bombiscardovia apis TaxID=2932182 RepID=A0ABM8BEN8_9BIFI|nr:DUF2188 domain-containing protein [Bombiscardovia apis]BDR55341.1 hypothetical protein KIMH_14520 [Bombiscardovia apis]
MAQPAVETYYEDGKWKIKVEGKERASKTFETKAEAQAAGRERAMELHTEHVIRNMDGKISEKNSYGNDPRPPKGSRG